MGWKDVYNHLMRGQPVGLSSVRKVIDEPGVDPQTRNFFQSYLDESPLGAIDKKYRKTVKKVDEQNRNVYDDAMRAYDDAMRRADEAINRN